MFFPVYTPEPYYPGRLGVTNTFRMVELALEQIEKNRGVVELALTASDIENSNRRGKMAAFLDLEGGFDLDVDLHLLRASALPAWARAVQLGGAHVSKKPVFRSLRRERLRLLFTFSRGEYRAR